MRLVIGSAMQMATVYRRGPSSAGYEAALGLAGSHASLVQDDSWRKSRELLNLGVFKQRNEVDQLIEKWLGCRRGLRMVRETNHRNPTVGLSLDP